MLAFYSYGTWRWETAVRRAQQRNDSHGRGIRNQKTPTTKSSRLGGTTLLCRFRCLVLHEQRRERQLEGNDEEENRLDRPTEVGSRSPAKH